MGRRGSLESGLGGFRERFHRRGDPRVPLAHGGDAVIESVVGEGTTFILDLPILIRTRRLVPIR